LDLLSLPPIALILDTAHAALLWCVGALQPLAGGAAAALVVVLLTLAVRAALIPTGVAQARAEQTRARLAPRMREIQRRHRRDRERMQRELMALYAREHASPLAGCLPLLIQAPILALLYSLFVAPTIAGHPNALLSEHLLGVPLGTSLVGAIGHGTAEPATFAVIGAIALLIAGVGEVTRRALRPPAAATGEPGPLGSPGLVRAMGLLQFVTAVVAMFVPLAAALYLLVTVAWTLVQRLLLRRRYPLDSAG